MVKFDSKALIISKIEHNRFTKLKKLNEYLTYFDKEFISISFIKADENKKNLLYTIFGYLLDSLNDIETNEENRENSLNNYFIFS